MLTMLTVQEVAQVLKVSEARVYELVRQGIIPHTRLGRQLRVNPEILSEFIRGGGKALPGGWKREA